MDIRSSFPCIEDISKLPTRRYLHSKLLHRFVSGTLSYNVGTPKYYGILAITIESHKFAWRLSERTLMSCSGSPNVELRRATFAPDIPNLESEFVHRLFS